MSFLLDTKLISVDAFQNDDNVLMIDTNQPFVFKMLGWFYFAVLFFSFLEMYLRLLIHVFE